MAYLRDVRFDKVRADLSTAAGERGCVTRTALRWGFSHFGQFSAAYKCRFGELPSQTVARRVGH